MSGDTTTGNVNLFNGEIMTPIAKTIAHPNVTASQLFDEIYRKNPLKQSGDGVPKSTLLEEANNTAGKDEDRGKVYGPATKNFTDTANILNSLGFRFNDKDGNTVLVEACHIPLMMLGVKMARLLNDPKCYHRDTLKDIAGYAKTADEVYLGI